MFNLSTSSLEEEGVITALFVEWKDVVRCALFHTCFLSDEDGEHCQFSEGHSCFWSPCF